MNKEDEENLKLLDKAIREKIKELTLAVHDGDVKGMVVIYIDAQGSVKTMQAYTNLQAIHIFMTCSLMQDQIKDMLKPGSHEFKLRD